MIYATSIGQKQLEEISEGSRVIVTLEVNAECRVFMTGDILALNEINEVGELTGRFAFCYITDALYDVRYCNPKCQILSLKPTLLDDRILPEGTLWRESDEYIYENERRAKLAEGK